MAETNTLLLEATESRAEIAEFSAEQQLGGLALENTVRVADVPTEVQAEARRAPLHLTRTQYFGKFGRSAMGFATW